LDQIESEIGPIKCIFLAILMSWLSVLDMLVWKQRSLLRA